MRRSFDSRGTLMNEDLVPQDVVTAVLAASTHARPVLLTFKFHSRDFIQQVEAVVQLMTGSDTAQGNVIKCAADVSWPTLAANLAQCAATGVLLRSIDKLTRDVQLHLGYALMAESAKANPMVVVCTSAPTPTRLHPILRKQLLLKQDIDFSREQLVMVAMPVAAVAGEKLRATFKARAAAVTIVPELQRYMEDIVVFIRAHRLVRGGISPQAVQDFHLVTRSLCVLHETDFATPLIIKRAARLVLPLKLRFVRPEDEPSLQYGGDLDAVKTWIRDWDGDVLVDSVLAEVALPA